jgi:His/Glu/Gln/Arg/opine family amino acid ABC transporter permease subunit
VPFDLFYTIEAMPRLLDGALITLGLAFAAMALSLVVGTGLAVTRAAAPRAARAAVAVYISFIRGTPLLVQIFLVFYALPAAGLDLDPFTAGVLALGLNSAAFTAEILRGGLAAIPAGQFEAARALALPRRIVWLKVTLPQVFRLASPVLVNEFTLVVKGTALVSVITVVELMRIAQQIYNANTRAPEVLLGVAAIYFVLLFSISQLADRLGGARVQRAAR